MRLRRNLNYLRHNELTCAQDHTRQRGPVHFPEQRQIKYLQQELDSILDVRVETTLLLGLRSDLF